MYAHNSHHVHGSYISYFQFSCALMVGLFYVKHLTSLGKKIGKKICLICDRVTSRSPTEWKVFGSVPSRHLTLDKAAGTAPRAVKVIYCWLCSL